MTTSKQTAAILALADGTVFKGVSIGKLGASTGEVVFNTAMTGYQEILTDPSYANQMVTLTYPHIGNTGCNGEDSESGRMHKVWANGLIIRDLPLLHSNFRAEMSLGEYLTKHDVVAIADIDTRKLTNLLRNTGAQNGCIMNADENGNLDEARAIELAKAAPSMKGLDLAKECCDKDGFEWTQGSWQLNHDGKNGKLSETGGRFAELGKDIEKRFNIVAYDFGVKTNILRMLVDRGCHVTVVPATTPVSEVLKHNPDGIFLSNGPGDPEPCTYAIDAIKSILNDTKIPVFGICLGHQLLALASGAKTIKMKFGHHGANHPVQNLADGTVMITSQNHGFAVDEASLPSHVKPTHRSLFDGSNQGIELVGRSAFSFQGHPEASPGPHDCSVLFDRFADEMARAKG
ncbi:carbamoyl-phosphate synthase small subunit [Moraxella caviae]|uniref:Carbamoyl phosphate synthase small chain n=1 Tax=Moraxella caviae TaxID=34060 RepID=A0A1S9ZYN3_9GAMM|nr:glutamine-hydrolyzing carbamoyl-phosphate synthase small subunit [Moraxella caviae]OOR88509.1 carbamoyl-phosphate synthase small subunit [Moraxella caviae]STZ14919.1 Carbamoyl-phosphate synthase small chain [Moraxella caviae]VEW12715.1 Carbamoyl-phosphate synthase small chain [Moraxella caviae]